MSRICRSLKTRMKQSLWRRGLGRRRNLPLQRGYIARPQLCRPPPRSTVDCQVDQNGCCNCNASKKRDRPNLPGPCIRGSVHNQLFWARDMKRPADSMIASKSLCHNPTAQGMYVSLSRLIQSSRIGTNQVNGVSLERLAHSFASSRRCRNKTPLAPAQNLNH